MTPERLLSRVHDIPPLSVVVMELMQLLNLKQVDHQRVERLIGDDPALASRVLRLANSSFFGFAGRIGNLREACLVLGAQTLRQIITAAAVKEHFSHDAGSVIDHRALWLHAMGTAAAARVLASEVGADPEQAFAAGLLHDMGKLALDTYFRDEYREVLLYQQEHACFLYEAEETVLGLTHNRVGAALASHWRFPDELVEAIDNHHSPGGDGAGLLADIVHVADVLSRALDIGDSGDDLVTPLSESAWKHLGLQWQRLRELLPEIDSMARENPFMEPQEKKE